MKFLLERCRATGQLIAIRPLSSILAMASICFTLVSSMCKAQEAPAPNSAPVSLPKLVQIPLQDCSGLPCIDLTTAAGKTVRLLIDTGEVNSYLDIKTAQSLNLSLQPLKGSDGNDIPEVQQTFVPGAKLGDLTLGDFPFMVLDTTVQPDKPNQKSRPLPADGTLTYSAFKNRLVQIDSAHHIVGISEPQESAQACPEACGDLVIKHFGGYGPVTLTSSGFVLNGEPIEAQVDTLFTGTMLVYPASVEKLGLKKESKSKHKEVFPYTQNGIQLAKAEGATEGFEQVPLLQNAPLYFMTTDEHAPNVSFDATVGTGLLNQAVVTFDFKGMHLWMEPAKP